MDAIVKHKRTADTEPVEVFIFSHIRSAVELAGGLYGVAMDNHLPLRKVAPSIAELIVLTASYAESAEWETLHPALTEIKDSLALVTEAVLDGEMVLAFERLIAVDQIAGHALASMQSGEEK